MRISASTIHGLCGVAQDLTKRQRFDTELADKILGQMADVPTLDAETRGAIEHARLVVTTVTDGAYARIAAARGALARVVLLMERHVAAVSPLD